MERIVDAVHIGFPKTGTTWLQESILPRVPGVVALGKPYLVDARYEDLLNRFTGCQEFDFSPERMRAEFQELQERNARHFGLESQRLISFELLSGELYAGTDAKQLLDRIHRTFGEVKILITIREQKAMVESLYRHYVAGGGGLHVREFLYKVTSPTVDIFGTRHLFLKLRYDRVIEYCYELFGRENVRVLAQEGIARDRAGFLDAYFGFIGVAVPQAAKINREVRNASLSYLGTCVLRPINQVISTPLSDSPLLRSLGSRYYGFVRRVFRPLDERVFAGLLGGRRFVTKKKKWWLVRVAKRALPRYRKDDDRARICDEIDRAYAASNRRTVELTGLPLEELGYCVAKPGDATPG
jgi:hypothetical protein